MSSWLIDNKKNRVHFHVAVSVTYITLQSLNVPSSSNISFDAKRYLLVQGFDRENVSLLRNRDEQ